MLGNILIPNQVDAEERNILGRAQDAASKSDYAALCVEANNLINKLGSVTDIHAKAYLTDPLAAIADIIKVDEASQPTLVGILKRIVIHSYDRQLRESAAYFLEDIRPSLPVQERIYVSRVIAIHMPGTGFKRRALTEICQDAQFLGPVRRDMELGAAAEFGLTP